jgi:ATP synthase F1 gamma subunit
MRGGAALRGTDGGGDLVASAMAGNLAPRLLTGTGSDRVHLVIVATADRGLCGGFNTNIVRRARILIDALLNDGKEVKIFCVGRKGRDQLRRLYSRYIIETVELTAVKRIGFADALGIARRVLDMYAEGQFDVATIVYARFKSVISQEPTAQRLIPAPVEITADTGGRVPSTIMSRTRQKSSPICCRATCRCRSSAPFWRMRHPAGRTHERDGFGYAQCWRSDRPADVAI